MSAIHAHAQRSERTSSERSERVPSAVVLPTSVVINNEDVEVSEHLLRVFDAIVRNVRFRFDVSTDLVSRWITDDKFLVHAQTVFHKHEDAVLDKLNNSAQVVELREIYRSDQPMEHLIRSMGWEAEECGHLHEKYDNGHQHFCGKYRHLHHSEPSDDPTVVIDHAFTRKTYQQMIDQKLFNIKLAAYQQFMDQVLKQLLSDIDQMIKREYRVYRTPVLDNISDICAWLKTRPDVFKARSGLVRQVRNETRDVLQMMSPTSGGTTREEYLDLFIPTSCEAPENIPMLPLKP